jgi:ribonucleoside-diphosphate reductase alpha chain
MVGITDPKPQVEVRSNGFQKVPLPADLLRDVPLADNARTVLRKRYLRRGEDGQPVESEQEMFWRVAYHVAKAEEEHGGAVEPVARRFYDLLTHLEFLPNSPTFTGAGTPLGQLSACFVLKIDDDMGRTGSGIFETLRDAALIQQTGGGNGFSFSRLRPKGAIVRSSNGEATGPVGFLRVYDQAFGEIAQGGCLSPDTLVFTERGLLRLDEIVHQQEIGWSSHELNVATDDGPRRSVQTYNNGVARVLRVRTDMGLELTGTPNHKVKVMRSSGPEWARLDELQAGDAVLVKLGQHQGHLQSLSRPISQHGNQIMPEFPAVLDEEFAFFLGYLVGDGFVASGENDHRIGVTVAHSSYLIDKMAALMNRLFGAHLTVHRMQKVDDASATFMVDNRAVKDFLTINGLAKVSSTSAFVPRLVRQSPRTVVGAFLRGLFEADGSTSHGYPQLMSSSKRLIHEVATLLIGLGCPVRISSQPLGKDHLGTTPMWHLRVHSFKGLQDWREWIGCDPGSRFNACQVFEPDLARESSYPLPCPEYWLEPVLEATLMPQIDARGRGRGKNFRATSPTLRKQLLRYTRGDRQLTLSGYERLLNQSSEFAEFAHPVDDLWFITVESVESAGESLTLDLEVEDNHTYLAGGWVTHNSRRGANMAVLRVDHPDVREFITCKTDENHITNFNISVGITEKFMRAVEADGDFELINPQNGKVWETVRARELFDLIVKQAHHNGEPGVLFLDAANRENPVPHLYELESTNPCGEQFLGPYENCCLGSINMARHVTADHRVDWEKLRQSVETSTRFLDDVVTSNAYVPAVPELKEAAHRVRRIGLGFMGLADMMYELGVRYGSPEGQEFASQLMEFVRFHAMQTSIDLAQERGAFPGIVGSVYDPANFTWQPPRALVASTRSWGRPAVDWSQIVAGIKQHGIRNGAVNTVAPTGTISTIAGCEGYGCEPVFALAYMRYVNDNGKQITLQYTSPLFERALRDAGLDDAIIQRIVEQVNLTGTCQAVKEVPDAIRRVFVVSGDVSVEEHVRMQAVLQAFTDNAISKTINAPAGATEADVAEAYKLGWKLGCKGLTVYVTGSREKVVLETAETKQKKEKPAEAAPQRLFNEEKKPRPRQLAGQTYRVPTPLGATYVTVNENGEGAGQPFEIFLHTAKAGSETAAISEALGRLISYILRLVSPVSPRNRLIEIVRQLSGIGGSRSIGFGPNRVSSLPDGIAQVLQEYLTESELIPDDAGAVAPVPDQQLSLPMEPAKKLGDLCPECGAATLVNEEGCRKCYSCGFSEC